MPDLLLELFSEEIPARMQAKAADDLRRMVTDKLVAEGLVYEGKGLRDAAAAGADGARHSGAAIRPQDRTQGSENRRARCRRAGLLESDRFEIAG